MKRFFSIQQAEKMADIYIFGDIVPVAWLEGDVTANGLAHQIEKLDVDTINVHIDSYGGAVSEGWAIYNALRSHPAKINTYGDGFVASAALYPFMAGENRFASSLSAYYFHEVMISTQGYAENLRAAADEAELMTEIGIKVFTERAGIPADEVKSLMKKETWLTPEKALEYGVATAIISDGTPNYIQGAKRKILERVFNLPVKQQSEADYILTPEKKQKEQEPPKKTIMQMLSGIYKDKDERGNKN